MACCTIYSLLYVSQIARHIVACLGPFRRPDCEQGRINTTKDFKRLARKVLTPLFALVNKLYIYVFINIRRCQGHSVFMSCPPASVGSLTASCLYSNRYVQAACLWLSAFVSCLQLSVCKVGRVLIAVLSATVNSTNVTLHCSS